jgi:hypothetical protein
MGIIEPNEATHSYLLFLEGSTVVEIGAYPVLRTGRENMFTIRMKAFVGKEIPIDGR